MLTRKALEKSLAPSSKLALTGWCSSPSAGPESCSSSGAAAPRCDGLRSHTAARWPWCGAAAGRGRGQRAGRMAAPAAPAWSGPRAASRTTAHPPRRSGPAGGVGGVSQKHKQRTVHVCRRAEWALTADWSDYSISQMCYLFFSF